MNRMEYNTVVQFLTALRFATRQRISSARMRMYVVLKHTLQFEIRNHFHLLRLDIQRDHPISLL